MTLQVWFWIFMVIGLVFGTWINYDPQRPWFRWGGGHLLIFILLAILGWQVFGSPVK